MKLQYDFYFLKFPATKKLFKILNNYDIEARFVGGCVRDAILNQTTDDFDVAVNSEISQVIYILRQHNIKVIPTGIKYNSVTVFIDDIKFEITSLRKDKECFGRDCLQSTISSFQEDARRRDFTINALYVSENQELFDYFGGVEDLNNRKIKFIGTPEKRIEEDYLRVFRYFRFCAKYEDFSNRYAEIIRKFSKNLSVLSIERVQQELFKILTLQRTATIIKIMNDDFVFSSIFKQPNIAIFERLPKNCSLEAKLFLLFNYDDLMNIFKLTRSQKRKIKEFYDLQNQPILFSQYEKGIEFAREVKLIKQAKFNEVVECENISFPNFPVTFRDLPCGILKASRKLKLCRRWWIVHNFNKSKQECLDFILNLDI